MKKRNHLILGAILAAALSSATYIVFAQNNPPKEEYCQSVSMTPGDNWVNPVFNNVKQVVIVVDVHPSSLEEEKGSNLPDALKKENLRKVLKELYTKRYASDGRKDSPTPRCYDRHDQDVIVMSDKDIKDGEHFKLAKDPGTLTVYFQVTFFDKGTFGLNIKDDTVALNVIHARSNLEIPIFNQATYPFPLSLDAPNEKLAAQIFNYMENRIK